ncbi:pumilio homolog 12 [Lactuca sativa]|uniref:PUM-HD domain-containing protein n=1 Tax=Lactuca sativa TaxID=4236 RepID=A0A9R1X760_LACSA|nr:pumilio homolog 12 [Lactuca sativa]KAJ0201234.1 hypothetical protein LSAT_V11C600340450 [Lactuca sativa]
MKPQSNNNIIQTPPQHYATGDEGTFQSFSPGVVTDSGVLPGYDPDQIASSLPPSIDVDEDVCSAFSSLNISPTTHLHSPKLLPENLQGEFRGFGSPISIGEGSVHPFRSDSGLRGGNTGNSSRRIYSSVGHAHPFTVDPRQHQQQPLWRNRDVFHEVRSSGFDFDQSADLLHTEQLNPYFFCSSNSSAQILDETFLPNTIHVNNSSFPRPVSDNHNLISTRFRNHQLLGFLSLNELRGRIVSLAKDQNGCRLLQSKFENPTNDEIETVLYEVLDSITDLMKDQFGNYLVQKLISFCNDDHKLRILLSLTDVPVQMVIVCMNPHGTRAMQKLLENLTDPYQIALAVAALRPGAARLANDPNGHHVIQYCLIHFPSEVNEPILNEIANKCFEVATDRSGCCVLQACVEHAHGEIRNRLVSQILADALHLAEHPYGNYVLQHMVGLNVLDFTTHLVRELQGNFASLSRNKYASNVVEKCLKASGKDISSVIVMELITSPNPSMLLVDPYANFVIQSALTVSTGFVYECLLEVISDNMSSMRSNLYGKKILAWFEKRRILGI